MDKPQFVITGKKDGMSQVSCACGTSITCKDIVYCPNCGQSEFITKVPYLWDLVVVKK